ncbi:hypothetical protein [Leifsonia aquatica]|uniref:Uncharacterized protein n=2 Tax=Leifsonia aquatica TaxID=144185 RepID=U2T7U8_LEIAQ|nr:hypothetical protein [Leifsonia aquatica]ERK73548.1 hypothetical protein N136_00106 [Leifsonia aquatica ATCC 14665]MBB2967996.1 DNA-directed RNA polymerase subunit RPC12/RpoP [Leifsonia aquatica]
MRSQLNPLPECVVASMTLRELGVHTDTPIGWAPACVALVTTVHAVRSGVRIDLTVVGTSIKLATQGGMIVVADDGVDPQMNAWFTADRTIALTCGACGRPGRRRTEPVGVQCDACAYLATAPAAAELPFTPRLPLPDEAIEAVRSLSVRNAPERFAIIPDGWARLVSSTLRDMPTPELADTVSFTVTDETVSLAFDDEAFPPSPELLVLNDRLEANARVHCQRCSRRMTTDPADPDHSTICPGCRWVESRGWEVVHADTI